MNIFVTGATGVIGRALVPELVVAGHTVSALSRAPRNDELLVRMDARPVATDLFAVDALTQALVHQDAIFHLATKIPPTMRMGRRAAWLENDRLRRDGTRHLVAAALAAGTVRTIIYPSFDFLYPSSSSAWLDAQTSGLDPAPTLVSTVDAEAAVARFAASDTGTTRRGISLRMGLFYGPESPSSLELLGYARRGIGVLPGAKYADMSRSLRIANRRFKAVSSWQPQVANARSGWQRIVEAGQARQPLQHSAVQH